MSARTATAAVMADLGAHHWRETDPWSLWHLPTPTGHLDIALDYRATSQAGIVLIDRTFTGANPVPGPCERDSAPGAWEWLCAALPPFARRAAAVSRRLPAAPEHAGVQSLCPVLKAELGDLLRLCIPQEACWQDAAAEGFSLPARTFPPPAATASPRRSAPTAAPTTGSSTPGVPTGSRACPRCPSTSTRASSHGTSPPASGKEEERHDRPRPPRP